MADIFLRDIEIVECQHVCIVIYGSSEQGLCIVFHLRQKKNTGTLWKADKK